MARIQASVRTQNWREKFVDSPRLLSVADADKLTPSKANTMKDFLPVESYSPESRAAFLLNNAVSAEDYRQARAEVKRMGLHPNRIKHHPPPKRA